jgi:hypothetical protein
MGPAGSSEPHAPRVWLFVRLWPAPSDPTRTACVPPGHAAALPSRTCSSPRRFACHSSALAVTLVQFMIGRDLLAAPVLTPRDPASSATQVLPPRHADTYLLAHYAATHIHETASCTATTD